MNAEFYIYIHVSVGEHLNKAIVSATCEMVINIINGKVDRYFDEEVVLKLFQF